jgi:SAM-dependent methyltransferase
MVGEPQPQGVLRREDGRRLFGLDPSVYEAGRPQYPAALYDALEQRGGLRDGARVLEIGPGTGLVTRRLLAEGASVVAVEPNPNLAAFLREAFNDAGPALEVVEAPFEEAEVDDAAFDLAVAATSFHWVDQRVGLAKLGRVIRPGGSVALWWTLYQDPTALDEFSLAAEEILGPRRLFGFDEADRPPFQLDVEHRVRDLRQWGGFEDVRSEIIKTPAVLDAGQVRALYASVAIVLRLEPDEQRTVLDALEELARDSFGGRIERIFVTALYTGRRATPAPE